MVDVDVVEKLIVSLFFLVAMLRGWAFICFVPFRVWSENVSFLFLLGFFFFSYIL